MIGNKELDKLIKDCKTSSELKELQIAFANETIGRITNNQAIRILKRQQELKEKENSFIRGGNEKTV